VRPVQGLEPPMWPREWGRIHSRCLQGTGTSCFLLSSPLNPRLPIFRARKPLLDCPKGVDACHETREGKKRI
jgi:hypothetical protein